MKMENTWLTIQLCAKKIFSNLQILLCIFRPVFK